MFKYLVTGTANDHMASTQGYLGLICAGHTALWKTFHVFLLSWSVEFIHSHQCQWSHTER